MRSSAKVLETRYIWAETIAEAMELAYKMQAIGWSIEGNPAPMVYNKKYGTGVAITREAMDV